MKRFILILAVVCTVFIGFGSVGYAFKNGDTIEGVTISVSNTNSHLDYLDSCEYYIKLGSTGKIYFGQYPFIADLTYSHIWWNSSESKRLYVSKSGGTLGTFTSTYIDIDPSDIIASNHDVYDSNGSLFFPPPPAPTPVPTPTPGLEGITTSLLMRVLLELKPILLGLAVSVIGFLAFRRAWNWVLANCRVG